MLPILKNQDGQHVSGQIILCSLFEVRQLISPSQVNLNLYNFMAILYKFRPKLCFCQLDLASKLDMLVSSR